MLPLRVFLHNTAQIAPRLSLQALALLLFTQACADLSKKPIDADTRRLIDSVSVAEIQRVRTETDSLYKSLRVTRLPLVIDSIKKRRVLEIEEQLRQLPR